MKLTTFSAFRNRNYRLFFAGQSLSQVGSWMQRTGVSWVVYERTHSAYMLGITVFAMQFPSFLFSLPGGIAADRYNRYKLLLLTQALSMLQAVLLAALTLSSSYSVTSILGLSIILGIINAFDVPARQPMVHEMITDKADLPNAMALNSAMVNLARLIGPALSGIVLQRYGAGICFSINAVSFVAVIISLLLMKMPPYVPRAEQKKPLAEIAEGFVYMKRTPVIGVTMLLLALVSLLVLPYNTVLPVFAKVIFKGDATTFGYINSFIGLGAVAGSLFLASLRQGADLKMVLLMNSVIFGIALACFSHIAWFPLAMLFAALTGFGMMSQTTLCITIVQVHGDAAMRGRMMGFVAMAYFGMLPLGSLITGAVSQHIGAPYTLLCQGILGIVIAVVFSKFLRSDRMDKKNNASLAEAQEIATEEL